MLESADAVADAAVFRTAGIGVTGATGYEREGSRPDGTPVTIAFSNAFARDAKAPDIGFAASQQHYPENFWHPELQRHANTVNAVAGVVLVAENPSDHHIFLSAFTGERELQATSSGITAPTRLGEIRVMDPTSFRDRFGVPAPEISSGARLAALRFAVRNREALIRALNAGEVAHASHLNTIVVPPEAAMGATLVFESN
jgi:hypothetical protein